MTTTAARAITLEEFLKLPETKPASEYIEGEIVQKPMPKGNYSRLQLRLCNAINDVAESRKIAYAFPELSCSFGTRSIVPDVAVFEWSRIPFDADGEAPNDFLMHPDWTIEILSPEQMPKQQPELCQGDDRLPVLEGIALELTAGQVFNWLRMAN